MPIDNYPNSEAKAEVKNTTQTVVDIDNEYLDPVSHEVMRYPVLLNSGHTIELESLMSILELSASEHCCPITRIPINSATPNRALQSLIDKFIEENPSLASERVMADAKLAAKYNNLTTTGNLIDNGPEENGHSDNELTPIFGALNNLPNEESRINNVDRDGYLPLVCGYAISCFFYGMYGSVTFAYYFLFDLKDKVISGDALKEIEDSIGDSLRIGEALIKETKEFGSILKGGLSLESSLGEVVGDLSNNGVVKGFALYMLLSFILVLGRLAYEVLVDRYWVNRRDGELSTSYADGLRFFERINNSDNNSRENNREDEPEETQDRSFTAS